MERPALYLSRITDLDQCPDLLGQYRSWLSPDEHRRFNRMRSPNQQRRFLLARGLVRQQLANRLSLQPDRISLALSPQGKPYLACASGLPSDCKFSLSHSGPWVAVAFADRAPVGVDLECPSRNRSLMAIARQFFHPEETRLLEALAGAALQNTFYRFWTQKEAYLKARGIGMAGGLATVSFAGDHDAPPNQPFRFENAEGPWQCFHWHNPTQESQPCFLSLAINTQRTEMPTLWRCLAKAEPDPLLSTKPS